MATEFFTKRPTRDVPAGTSAVVRYWGGYETGVRYEVFLPVGPDDALTRHAPEGEGTTLRGEMAQIPAGSGRDLAKACEAWRAEGRASANRLAR